MGEPDGGVGEVDEERDIRNHYQEEEENEKKLSGGEVEGKKEREGGDEGEAEKLKGARGIKKDGMGKRARRGGQSSRGEEAGEAKWRSWTKRGIRIGRS